MQHHTQGVHAYKVLNKETNYNQTKAGRIPAPQAFQGA